MSFKLVRFLVNPFRFNKEHLEESQPHTICGVIHIQTVGVLILPSYIPRYALGFPSYSIFRPWKKAIRLFFQSPNFAQSPLGTSV